MNSVVSHLTMEGVLINFNVKINIVANAVNSKIV